MAAELDGGRARAPPSRAVREAIARGDVYQVNVVGHASAPYQGDPLPALRRLDRAARRPATADVLTGDGWAIACASPETAGTGRGRPWSRPGRSRAPGRPPRPAGAELLASAKERAEHIMIVDLERNDLAHVARTGTVDVPELFAVRRWCDLWQAESRVVAPNSPTGSDLADAAARGVPGRLGHRRARSSPRWRQIAALEPVGRGPSMGALGWIDHDRLDLGLTIRTVAVDGDRVHLWAGGGITWDSDPDAEVAEAAAKAAPRPGRPRRQDPP